jgi:hypothetical protein
MLITACGVIHQTGNAPGGSTSLPSTSPPAIPEPTFPAVSAEQLSFLINEFQKYYNSPSLDFTVDFKPASYMNSQGGGTIIGVCELYSNQTKQVHMNSDWWATGSELQKRILVYHELGHCHFNRSHDSRTFSDGRPYSIMNPILNPVVSFFTNFKTYYLNELSSTAALLAQQRPITFTTLENGDCTDISPN